MLYAHSSAVPWLMHNVPYPVETISGIKKYIHTGWQQSGTGTEESAGVAQTVTRLQQQLEQ